MSKKDLHSQNIVACIWDFDKTLIPGFMQAPIFDHYGIDEARFWDEVNQLPDLYAARGLRVSRDTVYLNHMLSYVRRGPMTGLNNAKLRALGSELVFFPGLPGFFPELKELAFSKAEYISHEITLEHYIVSTGLAELVRGSEIAPFVDGIFGCEFVENPAPPGFSRQEELAMEVEGEISQIGVMVDNTIKTRFIFEINKGANKHPSIDVNATMRPEDRRIPIKNMIYIADGPSDVPVFSVVKKHGGRTFAVYDRANPKEFEQNDALLQAGRIQAYGPADYRNSSSTHKWLCMHVENICEEIAGERDKTLATRLSQPPRHLHVDQVADPEETESPDQATFLEEE